MKAKRPQTSLPIAYVSKGKDPNNKGASIWRATTSSGLELGKVQISASIFMDEKGRTVRTLNPEPVYMLTDACRERW